MDKEKDFKVFEAVVECKACGYHVDCCEHAMERLVCPKAGLGELRQLVEALSLNIIDGKTNHAEAFDAICAAIEVQE